MNSPSHNKSKNAKQEEVIRRFTYAEKLRTRKRPNLGLYIMVDVLIFLAVGAFFIFRAGIPASSWFSPVLIGITLLGAYVTWTRSSPLCPHCMKNIRMCHAVYCHVCGEPLKAGRCDRCGVLQSWTHIFSPLGETTGNKQPIRYCPSCAMPLDTAFYRWLGSGRHGKD